MPGRPSACPPGRAGGDAFNLMYPFRLHDTWMPKPGWLAYMFNTPSAHRVHHASNLDCLDANEGGVSSVFERPFSTCVAERVDERCRFGLVTSAPLAQPVRRRA